MTMTETPSRYVSCADTAKMIRAALKGEFGKAVKFSVRSDSYAGGASIRVKWTDGPTVAQVDAITNRYAGADFDGMQDMKVNREDTLVMGEDGIEALSFGADYVHTDRAYSDEAVAKVVAEIAEATGTTYDFSRPKYEGEGWKPIPGTYNGDGWNAAIPVHVEHGTGKVWALSNGTEYGGTVIHRALYPRDLR